MLSCCSAGSVPNSSVHLLDALLEVQVRYKIHTSSQGRCSLLQKRGWWIPASPTWSMGLSMGHRAMSSEWCSAGQGCLLQYRSGCCARFLGCFVIEIIIGFVIWLPLVSVHSHWKTSSPKVHQSSSSGQNTEIQDLQELHFWRRIREIRQQTPSSFRWLFRCSRICRNEVASSGVFREICFLVDPPQ